MDNFLSKTQEHTQRALQTLELMDEKEKFSSFSRRIFNQVGVKGASKAQEMMEELYDIACGGEEIVDEAGQKRKIRAEAETRIKAIKAAAEAMGGNMNEKQTNIQNNNYGNVFLDMLSNK